MLTKKDLWYHRQSGLELEDIKMQIQELTETMDGLKAQQITDMPKGGGLPHSAIETAVIKLEALRDVYAGKLARWCDNQQMIEHEISDKLNPIQAAVVRAYYFRRKTWEQVAVELNYDPRSITRIHGNALIALSA